MDKHLDDLRIKAGIGRAGLVGDELNFGLVVFNKEGDVIDPLIGLQKFAEMIIKECANVAADHEAIDIYEEILDHFEID
jgi:hypothetical protein